MIRISLLAILLSSSLAWGASTDHGIEQCGMRLQIAVGARVDVELVRMIMHESVSKDNMFQRLLLCLVAVESAFQPDAVSRAQATGLTQTTLIARLEVDRKWTGSVRPNMNVSTTEPILPIGKDVYFGSAYLALCLTWFEGNYPMALACYNGGPTQAKKLRANRQMCTETANYVSRIWKLYEAHCKVGE